MKDKYESFGEWFSDFSVNFMRMFMYVGLFLISLLIGVYSILLYVFRQICSFCKRETKAAVVVSVIIGLLSLGWISTIVKERMYRVTAEHQRDSMGYEMLKFKDTVDLYRDMAINASKKAESIISSLEAEKPVKKAKIAKNGAADSNNITPPVVEKEYTGESSVNYSEK